MKLFYKLTGLLLLLLPSLSQAQISNVTTVNLTFTPTDGGAAITATATDSGQGLVVSGDINLVESTDYDLAITLADANGDITPTVVSNSDDYLFFFGFSDEIITSPAGDGNIDMRADPMDYSDQDINTLPVGLATAWTTECTDADLAGTFRVILAFQDGTKSATSTATDGTQIFDLTWTANVASDPNAPPCENEEEIITDVTLTFTPMGGGDAIVARAQDPDGEGPLDLEILDDIELDESTEYTLSIDLQNSIEGESITEEIMEEDAEHMFFFAFTDGVFRSPAGDGNVDGRDDPMNYNDFDENGFPVGLSTSWETNCGEEATSGTFQVILKHQPDIKTATSTAQDGESDIDLTWNISVATDPNAPPCENEEEIITDVTLTFTPVDGGDAVIARAQDPDGEGPLDLQILDDIELVESTGYVLSIELLNSIEGEDITEEIMEEDDEHMFFFAFTDAVFRSPAGDGNVDNRDDPVNYLDFDENSLPVGLSTSWLVNCSEDAMDGTFQVILKHQPDIKTATSTAQDGESDIDLTWNISVATDPNAPPCENEEEVITDVTLTFTPMGGGDAIVARAQDPDGEGPLDLQILDDIELVESTEYTLSIELLNSIEGEDITEEIMEEDDEHMFFFAFTDGVFRSPAGDGNVDGRDDPMNYNDFDENGFPVGLSTGWETNCGEDATDGTFQVILKHQPDIKSATSTAQDGESDIDLTFNISVATDPNAPPCENEEEIITDVTLTFTPVDGGDVVVARAQDPDGEGPLDLQILDDIELLESTGYVLSIELENSIEGESITEEIMEEDDEHMFFFAFTDAVFRSPAGDGNVDNRDDPLNYLDFDENNLPVGLSTSWLVNCSEDAMDGTFQVILKHQPDIKTATSTAQDGESDIDLTWNISVVADPNAPPCENEEEVITDVTLTFTPTDGGDAVTASAQDPDGDGPLDLQILDDIELEEGKEYTLTIELLNSIEGESITEEIMEEDDEHMFFFGWTADAFSDPTGDGNIDNRDDPVNYNDFDENSLPVGLSTTWTTGGVLATAGTFQVILKHQPDIKTATSTSEDGESDIDLTFNLLIVEPTNIGSQVEANKEFKIWPNPTTNQLFWELETNPRSPVQLSILDLQGREVIRQSNPSTSVDLSNLQRGVYLVVLSNDKQKWTKRLMKIN